MHLSQIFIYLFLAFLGFASGRIGHILGGHLDGPHHWIHGLLLIIFGIFTWRSWIGSYALIFGTGLFVSDLRDFRLKRIWGPDDVETKKFWGID
ncbi:MAG: hypothetical protein Q8Q24_01440 [bacterium]|nr:hypothetical protein [bacterium]